MGRPSKGLRANATVRLDPATLARVDAFAEGEGLDRSSALCELITRGLDGSRVRVDKAQVQAVELATVARKQTQKPSASAQVKAVAAAVATLAPPVVAAKPKRVVGYAFDGSPIYR